MTGSPYPWTLVGDPTPIGWLTFAAYLLAALTCWRASRHLDLGRHRQGKSLPLHDRESRRLSRWWLWLGVLLLMLGLNKELDLQAGLRAVAKDLALTQGWYADRQAVQRVFVIALAMILGSAWLAAMWLLRRALRQIAAALIGLSLILAYVILRAAVFHVFPGARSADALSGLWLIEVGGIALVAWNAHRESQTARGAAA